MLTALVERARNGDEDAFTQLVDLDGDRCYAIAYRILRDVERAKDAVQQAFLLAWRELPRLREPERFQVWLYRLLVNAGYEEAARHRRWTAHPPAPGAPTAAAPRTLPRRPRGIGWPFTRPNLPTIDLWRLSVALGSATVTVVGAAPPLHFFAARPRGGGGG